MEELNHLFVRAQEGDLDAYGQIVRLFQDMAVGYAYSILGDFHLAEDASQEAFIETYLHFGKLYGPAVIPSWLRKAVSKHCDRLTRRRQVATVPLEEGLEPSSGEMAPDEMVAISEVKEGVSCAIEKLPERERVVTMLFYMGGYTQKEVGAFLEISAKTVKSRLHTARKILRERMIDMVEEQLRDQRPSRDEKFIVRVMEDLVGLTDGEIQMLLREVSEEELEIALTDASPKVKEKLLSNINNTLRAFVEVEIKAQRPLSPQKVKKAQQRILSLASEMEKLASDLAGKDDGSWKDHLLQRMKDRLKTTPISQMELDDIKALFGDLASLGPQKGIEVWDEVLPEDQLNEKLLLLGLNMVGQGLEPELMIDVLETRMHTYLQQQETRCKMVIAGIKALQTGYTPHVIKRKLASFY
ncbi:MAG: sigma-70 family RNA polymerase sigma factor [Gemmatimonadetes bacterium]|jgi:RNA polymerase sigma factor (sigma-70 family)|nr:sigma-70 family RNA polymerase sigma factor [Gemmatimonadota bacterium]MBT7915796.1 sigma-70 family RNA polymerase sigma factor [Candidatus Bathyarchaeota archaeon]